MLYDVTIIGKGPAGISAAIYAKRAGMQVLVIGKDGGALDKTEKIDNYYGFEETISGKELLQKGLKQARRLGIEVMTDEVIGIEYSTNYLVKTRNQTIETKALVLATGTSRKTPNIIGVKEFEGKGVSYCAVCDAFFYRNKEVSVLGSGDYAISEAKELLPVAKSVTILTNGEPIVENRSKSMENIAVNPKEIREVRGDNTVESILFADGSTLNTNGVFVAIGTASSSDLARKLGAILNKNAIVVDQNMATNVPGLYACGDCTGGLLQIAKAVHEGAVCGLAVSQYIRKK